MKSVLAAVAAVGLLAAGGAAHGFWTHRWVPWDSPQAQAAAARLERLPVDVGGWAGRQIETDPLSLPEEATGRGVTVKFTDLQDGMVVYAYIACGPTGASVAHVPTVCYPANGYDWCPPDRRVVLSPDPAGEQFRMSEFKRGADGLVIRVRVFWAWSDGSGWRTPDNPGREFRRSPVVFKCYLTRSLASPDEPSDTDPCGRLWAALQPELDRALFGD